MKDVLGILLLTGAVVLVLWIRQQAQNKTYEQSKRSRGEEPWKE